MTLRAVTETPMTTADRWAAVVALIAEVRAFELCACEAKSDEGQTLMLDEAHERGDRILDLLISEDADPMLDVLTDAVIAHQKGA